MADTLLMIRWREPDIEGYTDHIPMRLLRATQRDASFEHLVVSPQGREYRAKCALHAHGVFVDLDYSAFATYNERREMEVGVMRLVFNDTARTDLTSVHWQKPGSAKFQACDVEISYDSARPRKQEKLYEGAVRRMLRTQFERNPRARKLCIETHGTSCIVCGFSFGQTYGPDADGYIHVHHLRPLARKRAHDVVDPAVDLRPVCANCHAAIHLRNPPYTLEELRQLLKDATAASSPSNG